MAVESQKVVCCVDFCLIGSAYTQVGTTHIQQKHQGRRKQTLLQPLPCLHSYRICINLRYIANSLGSPKRGKWFTRAISAALLSHAHTVGGPLSATMGKRAQASPKQRLFTPSPPSSWGATTPPRCPPPWNGFGGFEYSYFCACVDMPCVPTRTGKTRNTNHTSYTRRGKPGNFARSPPGGPSAPTCGRAGPGTMQNYPREPQNA